MRKADGFGLFVMAAVFLLVQLPQSECKKRLLHPSTRHSSSSSSRSSSSSSSSRSNSDSIRYSDDGGRGDKAGGGASDNGSSSSMPRDRYAKYRSAESSRRRAALPPGASTIKGAQVIANHPLGPLNIAVQSLKTLLAPEIAMFYSIADGAAAAAGVPRGRAGSVRGPPLGGGRLPPKLKKLPPKGKRLPPPPLPPRSIKKYRRPQRGPRRPSSSPSSHSSSRRPPSSSSSFIPSNPEEPSFDRPSFDQPSFDAPSHFEQTASFKETPPSFDDFKDSMGELELEAVGPTRPSPGGGSAASFSAYGPSGPNGHPSDAHFKGIGIDDNNEIGGGFDSFSTFGSSFGSNSGDNYRPSKSSSSSLSSSSSRDRHPHFKDPRPPVFDDSEYYPLYPPLAPPPPRPSTSKRINPPGSSAFYPKIPNPAHDLSTFTSTRSTSSPPRDEHPDPPSLALPSSNGKDGDFPEEEEEDWRPLRPDPNQPGYGSTAPKVLTVKPKRQLSSSDKGFNKVIAETISSAQTSPSTGESESSQFPLFPQPPPPPKRAAPPPQPSRQHSRPQQTHIPKQPPTASQVYYKPYSPSANSEAKEPVPHPPRLSPMYPANSETPSSYSAHESLFGGSYEPRQEELEINDGANGPGVGFEKEGFRIPDFFRNFLSAPPVWINAQF